MNTFRPGFDRRFMIKALPGSILAALAMAMSSISVVSNSLRLYRARVK